MNEQFGGIEKAAKLRLQVNTSTDRSVDVGRLVEAKQVVAQKSGGESNRVRAVLNSAESRNLASRANVTIK